MSTIESVNQSPAVDESLAKDSPQETVQLPTGELLNVASVAIRSLDSVVKGYLRLATVIDPAQAAELYKKANPNSTLDASWFYRNKNLVQ